MKKLSTDEALVEIVHHYQSTLSLRQTAEHFGVHKNTIARRLHLAKERGLITEPSESRRVTVEEKSTSEGRVVSSSGSIRTLGELLDHASVDLDEWRVARHKVNKWDAQTRGGGTVELYQVTAWLEKRETFFLERIPSPLVYQPTYLEKTNEDKITLIVPDSQHGFRHVDGKLEPLHDRRALDVVLQTATLLSDKIETIILLGDMLDLAPWSKYPTTPDLRYTTQPALYSLFWFLSQLRAACPNARTYYLAGNHEVRIEKAIAQSADEALDLRPAGNPESRPVLSIPYLLSLDDLAIEYVEPYGKPLWHEGVRFQHGSLVRRRGGQTATAYLQHATTSGVWGHVHRLELAQRRIQTPTGSRIITAMSPGCLCRVDGAVPHAAGEPLDWQQGLGLMYTGASEPALQLIPIHEGEAVVHGRRIVGRERVEDIKAATGLNI